jgi:hypothetical protein
MWRAREVAQSSGEGGGEGGGESESESESESAIEGEALRSPPSVVACMRDRRGKSSRGEAVPIGKENPALVDRPVLGPKCSSGSGLGGMRRGKVDAGLPSL